MRKFFVLSAAALSLAAAFPPGPAQAGQKLGGGCSLGSLDFVSAVIGNIAKAPPITLPVNLTCRLNPALAYQWIEQKGYRVGYCWHIHNLPPTFQYRNVRLKPAILPNQVINYNFYAQNGRRIGADATNFGFANAMGFAEGSHSLYHIADSISMRFENNEGADLKPGIYQFSSATSFHGGMTAVPPGAAPNPNQPAMFCGTLNSGTNSIPPADYYSPQIMISPKINISVKTYCNIRKPPNADFGKYAALKNIRPIIVPVNVDCSAGTIYRVKVNNGRHAIGSQRYMTLNGSGSSGSHIAYDVGPVSWSGIGNGTPAGITENLNLTVPDQPAPPAGIYKDTLILTLERLPAPGDVYAYDYDGSDPRIHRLN